MVMIIGGKKQVRAVVHLQKTVSPVQGDYEWLTEISDQIIVQLLHFSGAHANS